jgi:NADH dehydrogenase [ubiquinone] 1 alpha subcomplex assembly factor 6
MFKNLRAGQDAGHEFEHEAEPGHDHGEAGNNSDDVSRGFGVLLEAVPAAEYLKSLEGNNFDPFMHWTWGNALLPLRLWQAAKREKF